MIVAVPFDIVAALADYWWIWLAIPAIGAYVAPSTQTTGTLITAAIWNQDCVSNPIALYAGAMSIASQAANDDIYASSTTQLGRGRRSLRQTFRGLHLRTSPNADVAATTVTLQHADEIILDDGTSVEDWDDLSAIITGAGAGGLDTGAEAASTWYEIVAIRKSSDGTQNLLLHRAKDYFLDEEQTTSDAELELREGATTNVKVGETFDTDEAGPLESVEFQLNKQGSPTGRMWAEVYATTAGVPTGAVLATSDKLDVSLVNAADQAIKFIFRSPLTLVAGTTYWVGLAGDYTASATVNIRMNYNTAGGYAAGSVYAYDGTSWAEIVAGDDLWFKVYVTRNDAAVTMPSGYDQQCKIGYVYNSAGSNFVGFAALDRTVIPLSELGAGTYTTAVPALANMSALIPPVPVRVSVAATNDGTVAASNRVGGVPDGFDSTSNQRLNNVVNLVNFAAAASSLRTGSIELFTEHQGLYFSRSASNGIFWVMDYTWSE